MMEAKTKAYNQDDATRFPETSSLGGFLDLYLRPPSPASSPQGEDMPE
jgi:hypothetical protein